MEAVRSSESSVNVYHTGRRQIPENSILFRQPSQNLKCHIQTTSCRVQEYVTNLTPTIPSASSLHIETAWEIERGFIIPEVPCLNPGRCILMSKFWGYFLLSVLKYWRIVASGIWTRPTSPFLCQVELLARSNFSFIKNCNYQKKRCGSKWNEYTVIWKKRVLKET
jgi:hypothetical protein